MIDIEKYVYKEVSANEYDIACENYKGSELLTRSRGLYLLYDKNSILLYIGWAGNGFCNRVGGHFRGTTNTISFKEQIHKAVLIKESSCDSFREEYLDCLDIEYYFIEKLNPIKNIRRSKNRAYLF